MSRLTIKVLLALLLCSAPARAAELVMFWQAGCEWCQRWDREIGAMYDKTPESKLLPLRRIDIRDQASSKIALDAPVRYTPTFIVVDEGREIGRITGYVNNESFWGLLGTFAAKVPPHAGAASRS